MSELRLHLRDIGRPLVDAWRREFEGVPHVEISHGDIFSTREGIVPLGSPIDVRADAIISPANSFGFMDGGIDAVYTYQFGPQVQERLQRIINTDFAGELPVGQAIIVETDSAEIPWCISAPTMRVPSVVADTANAYVAMRAAIAAVLRHNQTDAGQISILLCPGLGTAVGRMPVERCARQMRIAWNRFARGQMFVPRHLSEAARDEEELLR